MNNKKILVLLPDGVGLRNFAYTDFYKKAVEHGFSLTFWNNTPFNLESLGFDSVAMKPNFHPLTDLYKNARKQIELNLNIRRTKDPVYNSYRFPYRFNDVKSAIKSSIVKFLAFRFSSQKGLRTVRRKINDLERKTAFYHNSLEALKNENPAMVFCTNQRPISAIAPILAARDLGIPTATFIFSWDNLPKATMVIETDYYFVWSDHMKSELLEYYPYIPENKIFVTGTPQFETHLKKELLLSKDAFFQQYGLDQQKKYICFSGDDVNTSPNDPLYLRDVANAVRNLNSDGNNLGIIFRRCPVDLSDRYYEILRNNSDIIVPIAPEWKAFGQIWNAVLPTAEDLALQMNTIAHTELVINLGSSMVFDYASFDKPCAYINYDYSVSDSVRKNWSVAKTYDFVHFRSMPSQNSVGWLNSADTIADTIKQLLTDNRNQVAEAKQWFRKINVHPVENASERIIEAFESIIALQQQKDKPDHAAQNSAKLL